MIEFNWNDPRVLYSIFIRRVMLLKSIKREMNNVLYKKKKRLYAFVIVPFSLLRIRRESSK